MVKKAQKEEKKREKAAAAGGKGGSGGKAGGSSGPSLDAYNRGLPPGWQAFYDKGSGDVYYGNLKTKQTSWERPTS